MDKLLYETGFGIVPKSLMVNREISCEAKCLFNYLASFAGNGDSAFPGVDLIKYHLHWGNDRYYKARKELTDSGYLEVIQQKENGKFSHNIYKLHHTPFTQNPETVAGNPVNRKLKETVLKKTDNKKNNIYSDSKKASKKETLEKAYNEIFNYWNSKNIQQHKELTEPMKKAIKKAIDTYKDIEVIKEAITRYDEMLNSDYKYCTYKWTLEKFLKQDNALPDFMDEGSKWINYTSSKPKPVTEASTSPEDNPITFNDLSVEDTFKLLKEIKK